jgi:hypothetical protein
MAARMKHFLVLAFACYMPSRLFAMPVYTSRYAYANVFLSDILMCMPLSLHVLLCGRGQVVLWLYYYKGCYVTCPCADICIVLPGTPPVMVTPEGPPARGFVGHAMVVLVASVCFCSCALMCAIRAGVC